MVAHKVGPVAGRLLRLPAMVYRCHAGWLLGQRFLRLTHVGRKSGRLYRTVLEVIGADRESGEYLVIAGLGRTTDWYRNILAHPAADVTVGRSRFRPVHRELGEQESVTALAEYERRNRWVTPVLRRVLSWLVGWRYDGSDAARRRLVQELPVIAFRPANDRGAHTGT